MKWPKLAVAEADDTTYSQTGSRGLPWTAVKSPISSFSRQSPQVVDMFATQLRRRPACRCSRVHIELFEPEFSDGCQVVVPGNPDVVVFT